MCARNDDARSARRLPNIQKIKLHPAAGNVLLSENTLLLRHDRLRLVVETDQYLIALSLEYRTGDDISDLVRELLVDHLALGVLKLLYDDLAGGLRRDAPKILWQHLGADNVADFQLLVPPALRLLQSHLRVWISRVLHDLVDLVERELPVFYIDIDLGMLIAALELFIGGDHRGLKARDYRLFREPLFLLYLPENSFEIFSKLHFFPSTPFVVTIYFFFFGIFLNVFFCPVCGT
ncbi:hypothetical protein SDC9_131441 [bioreactor metagenome]|uniref:Uncharacterized protein n=1 Tax=bioreactor metagenome TaxID=1076179 RepID=A0A645D4F7_9ZZZZ